MPFMLQGEPAVRKATARAFTFGIMEWRFRIGLRRVVWRKEVDMKRLTVIFAVMFAACLFFSTASFAQTQKSTNTRVIANGTILPVQLNTTLSVDKSVDGQVISGRIAQDVQLQ